LVALIDEHYKQLPRRKIFRRLVSYAFFEGRQLTTRGRIINILVFALYRLWSILPLDTNNNRPIFIAGTGRSGTTILGTILSIHDKVGYLTEPKGMWAFIYPEDDAWGNFVKNTRGKYRIEAETATEERSRKINRIHAAYKKLTFTERVIDKFPELIFRYFYVCKIFPKCKFVVIIRNGWDTGRSIQQWSERNGSNEPGKKIDWWGENDRKWKAIVNDLVRQDDELGAYADQILAIDDHKVRGVIEWLLTMKETLYLVEEKNQPILVIKYEDLASDSNATLDQICEFAELGDDDDMKNYASMVMSPAVFKGEFELPDYIEGPFRRVMEQLEY
jgi:hypothetical protein